MNIAIIDYGSGNLRSVAKAFEHVAPNHSIVVTNKTAELVSASHIVLPGVGAFADCMRGLQSLDGMVDGLREQVLGKRKNFLGICVGMQMMFERGLEHGTHKGLDWLKGEVTQLGTKPQPSGHSEANPSCLMPHASCLKIPHMGWNELEMVQSHPVVKNIHTGGHAYFVHSYAANAEANDLIAVTQYGQPIAAIVGREHMIGTQFHPEKSQAVGLALLKNFTMM